MSPLAKLTIQCDDPWFTHIENGNKRVEGRKGQPKYKGLASGDLVQFRCTQEPDREFLVHVERVDFYESLEAYLESVGISTALPGVSTMEDALKIYSAWSTREEIERLGFVAINPSPKKVTICASEAKPKQRGEAPVCTRNTIAKGKGDEED